MVAAYRKATGTSLTQVSKRFYGNAGFLAAFFAGEQSISVSKLSGMIDSIRAEWPSGAEWPFMRPVIIPPPKRSREKNPGKISTDS